MIAVENLCLRQGNFRLDNLSLSVPGGSYAVLMGRTGCGKTSLLEAIAGLRPIASGRVILQGDDVTRFPPAQRGLGFVPQDGALFRTMTVRENIAFALELRRFPSSEIDRVVDDLAGWLHLGHLLRRRAVGLSGGETQRVALGRALAFSPAVLLMDEPLSSLDEETREHLIEKLKEVRNRFRVTVLHISHSKHEAEQLGDIVFRMENGVVEAMRKRAPTDETDARIFEK
jgi:molybdate/tungstate transport system ATP-binding protein